MYRTTPIAQVVYIHLVLNRLIRGYIIYYFSIHELFSVSIPIKGNSSSCTIRIIRSRSHIGSMVIRVTPCRPSCPGCIRSYSISIIKV